MANDKIMEALARIEHKVDLLLNITVVKDPSINFLLRQLSDLSHRCPVCGKLVDYNVDINDAVVIRKCGCSTGKIALDLKAFAPPISPEKTKRINDNGNDEEDNSRESRKPIKK